MSDDPLKELWTFNTADADLRILTPHEAWLGRFAGLDLGDAPGRLALSPLKWARETLAQRLGAAPRFQVNVVVVPSNARYRAKWRHEGNSDLLPMTVLVAVDEEASADEFLSNSLFFGAHVFIHEAVHFMAVTPFEPQLRMQNKVSEESEAYLLSTCSALVTGALEPLQVVTGLPLTGGAALEFNGLPSREVLRAVQARVRDQVGRLRASEKGSVLAGLAIAEAAGHRESAGSPEQREKLGKWCASVFASGLNWLDERPCQRDRFRRLC